MKVINFKPGKYGYTNRDFTWTLCPLLNAPGRMGQTDLSLRLLLEKEEEKVKSTVFEIKRLNDQRKDLTSQNTQIVSNEVFNQNDKDDFVYVVSVTGIPHGVTGIIGSRLKETYGRPVFLFIEEDGLCQGMGRSVEGFDLIDALEPMKDLFIKYGGHRQAAGVSMKKEDLLEFKKRINETAKKTLTEDDLIPQISIDLNAGFDDISIQTVRELFLLEPFGLGNPEPLFATLGGEIMDIFWMGDRKQHLKIRVRHNKNYNDVLMWNAPERYKDLKPGAKINICYGLSVNEFRGTERLQLMLEDMELC